MSFPSIIDDAARLMKISSVDRAKSIASERCLNLTRCTELI